jgi:hypothetical protein
MTAPTQGCGRVVTVATTALGRSRLRSTAARTCRQCDTEEIDKLLASQAVLQGEAMVPRVLNPYPMTVLDLERK